MASTERLHALLQSLLAERDRFAAHLYQSRRAYRRASETAGKSGKRMERCVISTFQIAESLGFRGDFRRWEHLLQLENDPNERCGCGVRKAQMRPARRKKPKKGVASRPGILQNSNKSVEKPVSAAKQTWKETFRTGT